MNDKCRKQGKELNSKTNRCVKKCKVDETRDGNKCKKSKNASLGPKTKKVPQDQNINKCTSQGKDLNPKTNRCVKKCKIDEERDIHFKCRKKTKKNKKPTSLKNKKPTSLKNIELQLPEIDKEKLINTTNTDKFFTFINKLQEKGKTYEQTGITFNTGTNNFLYQIFTFYLIQKYNIKCLILNSINGDNNFNLHSEIFRFNIKNTRLSTYDFNTVKRMNQNLNKFIKMFKSCIKNMENNILIVPISFISGSGMDISSHANLLIYRKTENIIEHFEPYGYSDTHNVITLLIEDIVPLISPTIKYVSPEELCPSGEGLQTIESELHLPTNINNREGNDAFCTLWSLFFAELVLLNPTLNSVEISNQLFEWLDSDPNRNGLFVKNIIRGYLHYMLKYSQDLIKKEYGMDYKQFDLRTSTNRAKYLELLKKIDQDVFTRFNQMNVHDYFDKDTLS